MEHWHRHGTNFLACITDVITAHGSALYTASYCDVSGFLILTVAQARKPFGEQTCKVN